MAIEAARPSWRRRVLRFLLGLGLSLGILSLLHVKTGLHLSMLVGEWRRADQGLLLLTLGLSTAFFVLFGAHKLWLVFRARGLEMPFSEVLRVRLGEGPLRLVLPLKAGELATVIYLWQRRAVPGSEAVGAVAFDRALNILAQGVWLVLGLLALPEPWAREPLIATTTVLLLGLIVLFASPLHQGLEALAGRLHPRIGRLVAGLLVPFRSIPPGRKLLLLGYGLLFVTRPLWVCWLLFAALGHRPHPARILTYTALAIFAGSIPGPLLGIGPREATLQALFAPQFPEGSGVPLSVTLLFTGVVYLVPFLVGLPWVPWLLRTLAARRAGPPGPPAQGTAT